MLLVLALLLCAVMLFLLCPRNRRRAGHQSRSGTPCFRYHGVSINAGASCCRAVRKVANRRYLQGETPVLPLPKCSAERCQCTYQHHDDRRREGDRRTFQEIALGLSQRPDGPEHRHNRGRRRLDYSR